MDSRVDFDINDALKHYSIDPASVATPEAPSELVDCENDPESLTPALINRVLNPVVDEVAQSPDAILRSSVFDTIQFLLKISAHIPLATLSKVLDLLTSALESQANSTDEDLRADDEESIPHHKKLLEMYAFLLQWTISAVETRALEKPTTVPARGRGKAKPKPTHDSWDSSSQVERALTVMLKTLGLKLSRVFVTTSERDTFIGLFTKPVYHILENEARVKKEGIKKCCFKVLCRAVKSHGHGFGAQTAIMQNLTYFEHLPEPMAEFLFILANEFDYPQLTEEVLKEVANKEFNPNDLKGPKSVSIFLAKISEFLPHLVVKHMTLLANILDSESYTLRCAVIEVIGNLIIMLSTQGDADRPEGEQRQIDIYFETLEDRFRDINPYVRCRVMQVWMKICDLEQLYPTKRMKVASLAQQSLKDKSTHVRRNAIKFLGKLVATHPFMVMEGQLSEKKWRERLEAVEAEMRALKPEELQERPEGEQTVDASMLQDATQMDDGTQLPEEMTEEEKIAKMRQIQEQAEKRAQLERDAETLARLATMRKYQKAALKFINIINESAELVTLLLTSKNKSEVIEAMDFFKIIHAYGVETAPTGIRKMLRLIWTKANNDEGKGIQTHLIECYKTLFFIPPPNYNSNDSAKYIASNMISLTYGTTPAELTSLEQLLSTMMQQGLVKDLVIQKLWQIYGQTQHEASKSQRRGAIIVLGMLALADPEIIKSEMETCLRIGLGQHGRRDLGLARYTCVALKRISPPPKKAAPGASQNAVKLPNDHPVLVSLARMTMLVTENNDYFGVAEQAIGAIYVLSKHPDVLCSDIIRHKTKYVFSLQTQEQRSRETTVDHDGDTEMGDAPPEEPVGSTQPPKKQKAAFALAQLLFIVGHVAIKQIVHLELTEQEFKRRKAEKEKNAPAPRQSNGTERSTPAPRGRGRKKASAKDAAPAAEEADELDLMAGTTEDDFTDHMRMVREQELLYGPQSLLANFGPLVADICQNKSQYNHTTLQAQAALCLGKLMCVSPQYCDQHLKLLLEILERTKDAVVRSNLVIALGDMAVCFNHLIDENTDYLYRRLTDRVVSVRRTCLMTLTFLILAGQVKVKGQLSEMAKCLEDEDKKIADMAKMFFTELAGKDNAVYNQFTDMFSVLSKDATLSEDAFKRIIKFLAGFIEKDKHAKQLAGKLSLRLAKAEDQREWNYISYALGLLQHKDDEIQKQIAEGFQVVQAEA